MRNYDVIIIGIGGMGSATAFHLAQRGLKVLGLETHNIPHSLGSSHGSTRIIRLCYYEHPSYVPLLRRAYELWHDLQNQVGEQLLHITGSIDAGPEGSDVFEGSLQSCKIYDLPHEVLNHLELKKRFPGYCMPSTIRAVFQPQGGFLRPERCIVNYVILSQALGAEIRAREKVIDWQPFSNGVQVRTEKGVYFAEKLVITAGAWVGQLVHGLAPLAIPERQVIGWFQPTVLDFFLPSNFPVFNMRVEEGRYYGFPIFEVPGFKVGRWHHQEETIKPDQLGNYTTPEDETLLRTFIQRYFPQGAGPTMALAPCLFTNLPDEHFIMDFHPEYSQVVIASPCSGHGFKFCSVIGEIMADLVQKGKTSHFIDMHRFNRFKTFI